MKVHRISLAKVKRSRKFLPPFSFILFIAIVIFLCLRRRSNRVYEPAIRALLSAENTHTIKFDSPKIINQCDEESVGIDSETVLEERNSENESQVETDPLEKIVKYDEEASKIQVNTNDTSQNEIDPLEKIDWHDEDFILMESTRNGNGEHGAPAKLPPHHNQNKCNDTKIYRNIGYKGCLSDYISVNRSMPDCRPTGCQNIKYRRHLPEVSVIIPIHNEHWSVLLRAIYSILNRSPSKLIKEIILIDDGSTDVCMQKQLDDYVAANLSKVRIFHVPPPRKGLMAARMLGARNATGEVLLFLDSNIEANVNWLPPLLEPITENYKTCVCPVIDVINVRTFQIKSVGQGHRNAFNWLLDWVKLPMLPSDLKNPTTPFKNIVMVGCSFAISKRFFWELGGYDPGLLLWGGEQYELSFKVWQCGGVLMDVPCSRVAHLYRGIYQPFKNPGVGDYITRNYKRVAEVWMDEYAKYVYARRPNYGSVDPGDLSKQRELRERLKCKSFKWFMEEVAFDIEKKYPLRKLPDYGWGKIRTSLDNHLCLTAKETSKSTELQTCSYSKSKDHRQTFFLSWHKDIRIQRRPYCLDVRSTDLEAPIGLYRCHGRLGNQLWRYNLETQQFVFGKEGNRCMSFHPQTRKVYLEKCDETSKSQKWIVDGPLNRDALKKWNETEPLVY